MEHSTLQSISRRLCRNMKFEKILVCRSNGINQQEQQVDNEIHQELLIIVPRLLLAC
jgi:hypothetical protein